jgi:putative endopeptidase
MKSALLVAAALGALAFAMPVRAAEPAKASPRPLFGAWGVDLTGEDPKVKPGDNFFDYANGGWLERTRIPADETSYGAFDMLADLSEARVHGILEAEAARLGAAGSSEGKVGGAYLAYMDEVGIERKGTAPLKPILGAIQEVRDRTELAALMGRPGYSAVFRLDIDPDFKDPTRYQVFLSQGGLGLPDRDYYLTAQFVEKKKAYEAYVAKMLGLIGWPGAAARASDIVAFETKIAEVSWTLAERRDPTKSYNPTTVAALERAAPGFAWGRMLASADLSGRSDVVAVTNTSLPKIAVLYAEAPLETLKAWEAFHTTDSLAGVLPKAFVDARFDFRGKTLTGQPVNVARWKRAVRALDGEVGEAVGAIYVAKYFPPASKAKMEALIGDLKTGFAKQIQALDWMSASTKAQALAKLANYDVQIGYPKMWRDYSGLEIRADDAFGNALRSTAFEWAYKVRRLNQGVDKDEWLMTPQTVNAYNNPYFNEVVFPAAILQPPFFNPKADPAVNYGAIGGVIGHEMTHGFDDQGRHFDAHGQLRDWWTPEDAERFKAKAKVLGEQYSAIEPLPGAHLKGDQTMGENIADLGGLTLALEAYHASLGGKPAPVIDGLTGDQRVFLGWAQVWREKDREDALRQQIASDEHAPAEARVNAVVRNIDAWYAAWGAKPGDKLYLAPDQRVRIW